MDQKRSGRQNKELGAIFKVLLGVKMSNFDIEDFEKTWPFLRLWKWSDLIGQILHFCSFRIIIRNEQKIYYNLNYNHFREKIPLERVKYRLTWICD